MIAFATLFLGLYLGPQTVTLAVAAEVDRVELLLDGDRVAELTAPPWVAEIDLGEALEPHELVAVAYDAGGAETGRSRQTINLPRSLADAEIVLSGAEDGRDAVARLTWKSVDGRRPRAVRARLDGTPLAVVDFSEIALPDFDPGRLHFLSVELEFDDTVSATVETTFGGTYADELSFELTGVPVSVRGRRPTPSALSGRFTRDGRALEVLAVDREPGRLVVVRDVGAEPAVWELVDEALSGRGVRVRGGQSLSEAGGASALRWAAKLRKDQTLRFLWPLPRSVTRGATSYDLFPPSAELSHRDGGILHLISEVPPPPGAPEGQRLADAVAVAGMMAAGTNRARAVLLVLGPEPHDASQLSAAEAARFLELLRVPLRVWRLGDGAASTAWPGSVEVRSLQDLERHGRRLVEAVDRQHVVWLEGLHLPHRVELRGGGDRLQLAR